MPNQWDGLSLPISLLAPIQKQFCSSSLMSLLILHLSVVFRFVPLISHVLPDNLLLKIDEAWHELLPFFSFIFFVCLLLWLILPSVLLFFCFVFPWVSPGHLLTPFSPDFQIPCLLASFWLMPFLEIFYNGKWAISVVSNTMSYTIFWKQSQYLILLSGILENVFQPRIQVQSIGSFRKKEKKIKVQI